MELHDRSALLTGADRGIGLATARALLDAGVGRVYAGARDTDALEPLVQQYDERVVPLELDVTKARHVNAAARAAKDATIVINNACAATSGSLLDKAAAKNLKTEWEVNVLGLLRVVQAFAPVLAKNGGGTIANINSILSLRGKPTAGTYCAGKAASYSLTQTLRSELAPQGIHVVSVFPGTTDTDMTAGLTSEKADPHAVAGEIVRGIREDLAFVFPDAESLRLWHEFEAGPGPFLAALLPVERG